MRFIAERKGLPGDVSRAAAAAVTGSATEVSRRGRWKDGKPSTQAAARTMKRGGHSPG